jgi:hypothetical protein
MGAETSPLRVGSTGNDAAVSYSNASTPTTYNVRAGMSDTDDFSIWTSDTKRLTVKDNGNVGIGTTGPNESLHVYRASGDASFKLQTASQTLRIDQNSIRTTTSSAVGMFTNNNSSNGFRIEDDGRMIIGITSGQTNVKLTVKGNVKMGSAAHSSWANTINDIGGLDIIVGSGSTGLTVWDDNSQSTPRFKVTRDGNVGIGNTDPDKPLTVTANSGANAIAMRARSGDDYSFLQFWNNAGTTLRGQIYNHNGNIGFTTGTDSSAGDDLYISDSNGVGINTTTTGGYNGRLTVYQDTHDAYTPTGFLDKPTMQLRHANNVNGYTGIRYANNSGTYEWFTGAHQKTTNSADLVTQGYDRQLNGYHENQRIHDTGQIVQPRQPSFMAHKTSHLSLSGAGSSEAGGWSSTHVNGAHNVGGCFNTSTGRFTAPVAGRYKFDANIMHGRTSGDYQVWLCVNGNTSNCVKSNSMQSTGGDWKQTAVTGIFNLAVSDYISIFIRSSAAETYAMYGQTTAAFTTCNGYLIG